MQQQQLLQYCERSHRHCRHARVWPPEALPLLGLPPRPLSLPALHTGYLTHTIGSEHAFLICQVWRVKLEPCVYVAAPVVPVQLCLLYLSARLCITKATSPSMLEGWLVHQELAEN